MGIFDKLWKDPNEGKTTEVKKETPTKKTTTSSSKSIPTTNSNEVSNSNTIVTPTIGFSGTEQPEFVDYFKKVFTDANLPGPDYHEFVSALEFLKAQPMPDNMKFMSVFAGFTAQGCTKERLLDSAQVYLKLFAEKKDGFEKALETKFDEVVGSRENEVKRLTDENVSLDDQMRQLVEKKQANAETIAKLNTEITDESNKLKMNHANFLSTYERMSKEIAENSKKIAEFIA